MGATIHLSQENNKAIIRPSGWLKDGFSAYREAIEGSVYNGKENVAPLDKVPRILKRLREAGFPVDVTPELGKTLESFTAQNWLDLQAAKERADAIDAELKSRGKELYSYQRVGVQWLATKHGALLADDMGLGKTAQTLAALPASVGVVVVAPALAKGVWRKEVPMWRPHLTPTVLEGRGSFRWPDKGEVIIINYDILPEAHQKGCENPKECKGCAPFLKACPPGTVVVADEAHNLKSSKAKRTVSFRAIANAAREQNGRTWLLTATPLLNKPQELWNIFQAAGIAQEAFGSFKQFMAIFNGRMGKFGIEWGSPPDEELIKERIRSVSLRRTKDEVMRDIPGKRVQAVPVDVDKKTIKMLDGFLEDMGGAERVIELLESKKLDFEMLSAVRAALASAKIPAMLAHIEQYEEQDEPLVVFSAHRAPIDLLEGRDGWRTITGDTSSEERTRIVEEFQDGKLKGVACTIKAGGVAITLTRACHELFVDREWTPGLNAQAEDRCYRIGQTRGVLVKVLEADHILDNRVNELLGLKQAIIDASVEAARETIFSGQTDLDAGIRSQIQTVQDVLNAEPPPSDDDAPDAPPKKKVFKKHIAETSQEKWAEIALRILSGRDADFASQRNDVGFNKMDTATGNSLAMQLPELSDAQWRLAIKICRKYHRQVGECPEVEE